MPIHVIGGGLAGCEAAWQLANFGLRVILYEMRGEKSTPAHKSDDLAELVCSNSFRSDNIQSAIGLLHQEMRECNSLILTAADQSKLPAGSALAVDRKLFSDIINKALLSLKNVEIIRKEITNIPSNNHVIIATGPLTSETLTKEIANIIGGEQFLEFFDAISPIIYKDSIDFNKAWFQSRYDIGKDYINCPLNKEEYLHFIKELRAAEKLEFKEWEKDTPYFSGCLPIEVMAEKGVDTLRFGPMKPVGLQDPRTNSRPYAVLQLRQDNKLGTLYNLVGFQTKLKYTEQKRIFQIIPGLENAKFARYGGIHRNTFINSPKILDETLSLKSIANLKFAGQITGVEGYIESAAIGLLAGIFMASQVMCKTLHNLPENTALASLLKHITCNANAKTFQPMNINYGLFPPLTKKIDKKTFYAKESIPHIKNWYKTSQQILST